MKLFAYQPEIEEQITQIRQALHVRMNGEVSGNMTRKGFEYKLNYGTLLPEIKEVSQKYTPNKLLAERLWHLKIRETMILATYLYPIDEFSIEIADEWIDSITTTEMAEISCLNLFSKLSFSDKLVAKWVNSDKTLIQISGWILLARVCKNMPDNNLFFYVEKGTEAILANIGISQSIVLALKNIGRISESTANRLSSVLSEKSFSDSNRKYYDEIKQELNFYYNL